MISGQDYKGLVLFSKKAVNNKTSIQVNTFPKGTYLLLAVKGGLVESRKLVLN